MTTPSRDTLVVLPAVERFNGTGGAVATWVSEVYRADMAGFGSGVRIFAPRVGQDFSKGLDATTPLLYRLFDRCQEVAAKLIARLRRKPWWSVYTHVLHTLPIWKHFVQREISKKSYSTVIVHNRPEYLLSTSRTDAQLILHMHNDLANYVTECELNRLIALKVQFIFCSLAVKNNALEAFPQLPKDSCHVIYNGVTLLQPNSSADHRPHELTRIVYAGRLTEEKGPDIAILGCLDFLRSVGTESKPLSLDLYGGTHSGIVDPQTPFRARLASLADMVNAEFHEDVITLRGPVPQTELLSAFAHSDFFLYPCRWEEPFGMVIIEAMSRGCIPIASARGGIKEIICADKSGVLLSDSPTPREVSRAIQRLLASDELVSKLRKGAISRAEAFSWAQIVREYSSLLCKIKNAHPRRPYDE